MVEATQAVSFDPTNRQLGPSMRAAKANHMRGAAVAAIERQIFFENANWHGAARPKLMGAKNRLPEHSQVFSREGVGPGVNEIQIFCGSSHRSIYAPGFQPFVRRSVTTFRAMEKSKMRLNGGASFRSRRFKTFSTAFFCISSLRVPSWVIAGRTTCS